MSSSKERTSAKPSYDIAEFSIAIVSGLALAITAIFLCVAPITGKIAGARDFVVYWATGQQLVHHASPYDVDEMMRIEREAGLPGRYGVLFMRNPPWTLPLVYPLGFVGVRIGALIWSLLLIACLFASVRLVWKIYGSPRPLLNYLGYSFAPALVCLIVGQTSLFSLLGLVLFLRWHRERQWLAGISLWLCALKPHLFLVFGVVLCAWVVINLRYKIFFAAVAALAATCAAAWLIDPTAWADYIRMMRTYGIERESIPCWSVMLRLWLRPQATSLQYILPAVASVWAVAYFWNRRHRWDWASNGSLLILVSVVAAPYCWLFDQVVAVQALLHGAYQTRSRLLLAILAALSLSIDIGLIGGIKLPSLFYLWPAPIWLAWYLIARSRHATQTSDAII